jgi:hypothetical protein
MRSCRSTRWPAGWLALVALALQVALTFAHRPHEHGSGRMHTHATDPREIRGLVDAGDHGPGVPAQHDCAICLTMDLAAALDLPRPPPAAALPVALPARPTGAMLAFAPLLARYEPVRARAPPLA